MKTYRPQAGTHISAACEEAVTLAKQEGCNVEFDFNEIKLTATSDTDPLVLAQFYDDECTRRREAYHASPEYKAQQEEAERKDRERQATVDAMLAGTPEHMTLRDPEGWRKSCEVNSDGYGGAVMTYAERWARLMEARIAKGERLADIAKECSHIADEEGITGFMYGCAVSILAQVWIHGEELRRWHNLDTQIGSEGEKANESGGVLNPACLTIG
jgi:hypothetical protein